MVGALVYKTKFHFPTSDAAKVYKLPSFAVSLSQSIAHKTVATTHERRKIASDADKVNVAWAKIRTKALGQLNLSPDTIAKIEFAADAEVEKSLSKKDYAYLQSVREEFNKRTQRHVRNAKTVSHLW